MTGWNQGDDARAANAGWICLPIAAVALLLFDVVTGPMVAEPPGPAATTPAPSNSPSQQAMATEPKRSGRGRSTPRHVAPALVGGMQPDLDDAVDLVLRLGDVDADAVRDYLARTGSSLVLVRFDAERKVERFVEPGFFGLPERERSHREWPAFYRKHAAPDRCWIRIHRPEAPQIDRILRDWVGDWQPCLVLGPAVSRRLWRDRAARLAAIGDRGRQQRTLTVLRARRGAHGSAMALDLHIEPGE